MTTLIGEKQLVAIAFSDVVAFSQRVGRDEPGTLLAVGKDLKHMTRVAEGQYGGKVIKSTGDGLLLRFSSASEAVSFALQVQREFAERARLDPEALVHRIGVHLGDVFLRDDDVMGDGVNIAARLQHEAEPGGICISQTVFDVIRGKVVAEAVSLGPRELKNIQQSIHAYQLVIDATKSGGGVRQDVSPISARASVGGAGVGSWMTKGLIMALVGGALLAVFAVARFVWNPGVPADGSSNQVPRAVSDVSGRAAAGPPAKEIPGMSRQARVFVGARGVMIVVFTLGAMPGQRALIQIVGCDDPAWDGRIVEHSVQPDGDRVDYMRRNADGSEGFTLHGRDIGLPSERWLGAVPGAQQVEDFTYSSSESKQFDRDKFLREYWKQMK